MTTGVYCIKHIESGRVYVGSAVDIHRRWREHRTRLNSNRHGNAYFQRTWTKYGSDAFEMAILEECSADMRLVREQYWIDRYQADREETGFNLIPTRLAQGFGEAWSRVQKKRWAPHDRRSRQRMCAHLMEPKARARGQALATAAKQSSEYSDLRREIAKRGLTTAANRAGNSARLKAMWQDPVFRAARLAGLDRGRTKTNAARRKSSGDEIV